MRPRVHYATKVVPRPVVRKEVKNDIENADAEGARTSSGVPAEGQSYIRWADWLRRVSGVDALRCPRCKGRQHMISVITDPETARKVLEGVRNAVTKMAVAKVGEARPLLYAQVRAARHRLNWQADYRCRRVKDGWTSVARPARQSGAC